MTRAAIRNLRPHYFLGLLTLGLVLNSFDRSLLAVLLEPIGREFGANDTQLGLLTGFAFAAVYSLCGIPIASYADRGNRRNVLAIGMLVWSVMTAACGLAPAFLWLLMARMGTAIGEAAGTPASHALIGDLFPPGRRATALAVYSIGAPAGSGLAGLLGGHGADWLGWRVTMMLAALPGVVLACAILLTTAEPVRQHALAPAAASRSRGSWVSVARELWLVPAYRHLWFGVALHGIAIFAAASFNAAWLIRSWSWTASSAGTLVGVLGVTGALGVFLGGWIADRLNRHSGGMQWTLRVAAIATLCAVPFQFAAYLAPGAYWIVIALPLASFFGNAFYAPAFAGAQVLAPTDARATAAALLLFAMGMVGMGLGPLLTGMLSDAFASYAGEGSLRYALLLAPLVNLWAAAHFYAAARCSLTAPSDASLVA